MADLLKASGGTATGLLGKQSAPSNLGYDAFLIIVPAGTEIATKTLALTEDTWLDGINSADSSRFRVLPIFYDIEPAKEDDVYATSSIGSVSFVRDGKLTMKYIVEVTPVVMEQLRTMNGVDWECYVGTSEGFIKATTSDNAKFEPFSLQNFRVEGETPAAGDATALVPISVTFDDPNEWNSNPAFVEPLRDGEGGNWNPRDLKDPKAIMGTVTSPTTSGYTLYLEGYDKVAHEGAVLGDIGIWDSVGALVTVTGLTETPAGTYAITATLPAGTFTTGLLPVGSCTTDGYATLERDRTSFITS